MIASLVWERSCSITREIGKGSIIGRRRHPLGKKIPPGSKVMGVPGKVVGEVSEWEATMMIGGGHHEYQKLLADYKGGGDDE